MTDTNKLKELAAQYLANPSGTAGEDSEFRAAANPQAILGLIAEVERLRSRLEIDERIPHDGIACREETIKALDEKCDKLKAENNALREALSQISNASCSDARSVVIARTVLTKGATK
ncbi:TPA: hypothetical protein SLW25_001541 [Pseudomonas aeruginosa]|nr:hypothetical protein [Pseudomonas aeruginosa]